MKTIHSITVTAVVLMFVLSAFAGTAAAAHDPKDPEHDNLYPDSVFDEGVVPGTGVASDAPPEDRFLKAKKAFNENVPEVGLIGFGSFDENYPDSVFDGDGDQVEDGPEIQG